jgi:hypothetical protein
MFFLYKEIQFRYWVQTTPLNTSTTGERTDSENAQSRFTVLFQAHTIPFSGSRATLKPLLLPSCCGGHCFSSLKVASFKTQ